MKRNPSEPKREDDSDRNLHCDACGEKFNSLAEAEQHGRNCLNRVASGADQEHNPRGK